MESLIRLSQGQLNLLEKCPPRFQQIYLEQLRSPVSLEQQEKQDWGSRFHLLMQQRELGLPIEPLLEEDQQLQRSLTSLIEAAPEIVRSEPETWREAEHHRTYSFQNYLLTVIYDLIIAGPSKAQIIDWKTYLQAQNQARLAQDWQTRLYMYVLAETSEYLPEQISMTYWFVKLPTKPQRLTFTYDSLQHENTKQDLTNLLTKLETWIEEYFNQGSSFPHPPNCEESCPYYDLAVAESSLTHPLHRPSDDSCGGATQTATETAVTAGQNEGDNNWYAAIAQIEEVSL